MDDKLLREARGIDYTGITTAFICHDGTGRVFMAKRGQNARDEQGRWDCGAGGLDWGLTAKENAIKEIEEEYGITPQKIEFIGYRDVFRTLDDGRRTHWLSLDFLALVDPKETRNNEPHKLEDAGWFTLDNLPAPLHSQVRHVFEKYGAKMPKPTP